MDSNLSRQYSPPASVSPSITGYYTQTSKNNSNNSPSSSLPTATDLTSIRADLERVLTHTEKRRKYLEKDITHLQKNVKIHDSGYYYSYFFKIYDIIYIHMCIYTCTDIYMYIYK